MSDDNKNYTFDDLIEDLKNYKGGLFKGLNLFLEEVKDKTVEEDDKGNLIYRDKNGKVRFKWSTDDEMSVYKADGQPFCLLKKDGKELFFKTMSDFYRAINMHRGLYHIGEYVQDHVAEVVDFKKKKDEVGNDIYCDKNDKVRVRCFKDGSKTIYDDIEVPMYHVMPSNKALICVSCTELFERLQNCQADLIDVELNKCELTDVRKATDSFGNQILFDKKSNMRMKIDPEGNKTLYYENGNVFCSIDRSGQVTKYDENGKKITQSDKSSKVLQYGIDGKLKSAILPSGEQEFYYPTGELERKEGKPVYPTAENGLKETIYPCTTFTKKGKIKYQLDAAGNETICYPGALKQYNSGWCTTDIHGNKKRYQSDGKLCWEQDNKGAGMMYYKDGVHVKKVWDSEGNEQYFDKNSDKVEYSIFKAKIDKGDGIERTVDIVYDADGNENKLATKRRALAKKLGIQKLIDARAPKVVRKIENFISKRLNQGR